MLWPGTRDLAQDAGMMTYLSRWLPVAVLAVAVTGCGNDPRGLLRDMAAAYRAADHYADEARVIVRHTQGGQSTESVQPFRVAFSRPDRLRIDAYDARVVADGSRLFAASGGVPGQVLVDDIRSPLDMDQLFADDVLQGTLTQGEAGCPPQVPLLLADDTLEVILADATGPPRTVGVETVDGRSCQRIAVPKPDGVLEVWVDRELKLLRRMRVPTSAYADEASREAGVPVGISVDVEFTNAAFTEAPTEAFVFEVPATAIEVAKLEPLNRPQAAHPRLGSKAGLPPLATADGVTADAAATGEGPIVLDFFFAGCGPASRTLPAVATGITAFVATHAAQHGGERPALRHLAVSLDPDDVPTSEVRRSLAEFGGVGTLVRDPQAIAAQALGLETFPATVIVSGDGDVADVIVGDGPQIAGDVTETLAALARGQPTAGLVRGRHRRRIDDYRRTLASAAGGVDERLAEAVIAPPRQPARFKLVPAWRASVALPGNVVCLDAASGAAEPRIVVLDGWRTVVEFDAAGTERGRKELDLPADAGLAFLRTEVAADGRRWWLGGRRGGRRVFVFDDAWRLHASIPATGEADTVADAVLADLGGDGEPDVIVAYSGTTGLEATTLGGERIWQDGEIGALTCMAVGPPVAAGGERIVIGCTAEGRWKRARQPDEVTAAAGGPAFAALAAGPVAVNGGWSIIGTCPAHQAKGLAAGIDPDTLDLMWRLPLAAGGHRDGPLEPMAWADLLGTPRRQWLIAGPDGSVTAAWADGRVVDRYFHGRPLVGLGGYRHGNRGHVVIATRQGVEAFLVDDIALD
jgi:hypothetical protein